MFSNMLNLFADKCDGGNFLGLVPWYKYLDQTTSDCSIRSFNILPGKGNIDRAPSDIPLVLLAVIDNLIRIAALIAVIFIVYGGVMYATSQGSPDQAAKAQSTVINALAGLAIAIIAVVIVTFIGNRLG